MKTTVYNQSRSTGRLSAVISVCRHGLLVLSSLAALSAQAGQPMETVFIGGTSALSVDDFGISRSVATPLTANTVITGTVWLGPTTDKITFTLPADYKIDSANVSVSNYVAAGGTPDTGPRVLFKNGSTTYGSVAFSGNGNNIVQFTSPVPAGQFDLQITAPSGLQSGGMFQPAFSTQVGTSVPTTTYGSASYVITLNISPITITVPIADLAGDYIGLVGSDRKIRSKIAQIVSPTPVKPIPNEALGARLDMKVNPSGTVTGKLVYGPTVISFTGAFTVSAGNALPKLVIAIPAYNRSLVLNFGTDEKDEGYIYGALVQRGDESGMYRNNTQGWKNTWTTTRTPEPAFTSYKTFSIQGGSGPDGFGFGSVTEGAAVGTYLAAGTLADGQKFTSTGFYGPSGGFLIYQYLYASLGKGSFSGSAEVSSGNIAGRVQEADTVIPLPASLDGQFRWLKQPSPLATTSAASGPLKKYGKRKRARATASLDTLYPEGFEDTTFLAGGSYTPPAAGQVLNVSGNRLASVTGISTDIRFIDYQPFGVDFRAGVHITSPGSTSLVNLLSVPSGSYAGLSSASELSFQSFDVTTGLFKGSFKVTPPLRTINFEGIFLTYNFSGFYEGHGYFIGNRIDAADGRPPVMSRQRVSGSVIIRSRDN